jgi:hypothetical protein
MSRAIITINESPARIKHLRWSKTTKDVTNWAAKASQRLENMGHLFGKSSL